MILLSNNLSVFWPTITIHKMVKFHWSIKIVEWRGSLLRFFIMCLKRYISLAIGLNVASHPFQHILLSQYSLYWFFVDKYWHKILPQHWNVIIIGNWLEIFPHFIGNISIIKPISSQYWRFIANIATVNQF